MEQAGDTLYLDPTLPHHGKQRAQSVPINRRKPKNRKRISFQEQDMSEVQMRAPPSRSRKQSVAPPPVDKRPEWYEDLTEDQINMFKEIFEMLDSDGGGSIDASELFSLLKDLDTEVSLDEIKSVLMDLDKDGNGEIDFDEFLYAMAETKHLMDLEQSSSDRESGAYSKRQTLFFTAITRFAIKNSLGEIERYYANKQRQAPHVISCYTAGVRLIGLNDKQLEQEMRRMHKSNRNNKSPYAKPLPFVLPKRKSHGHKKPPPIKRRASLKPEQAPNPRRISYAPITPMIVEESVSGSPISGSQISGSPTPHDDIVPLVPSCASGRIRRGSKTSSQDMNSPTIKCESSRRAAITPEELEVMKILQDMAKTGNVVARLPGIHLVPQIRNKLVSGDANPICSSVRKKRRTLQELSLGNGVPPYVNGKKHEMRSTRGGPRGWVIPRIERGQAPLPVIKLSDGNVEKTFTIEDVNDIRKWVSEAMDKYYSTLRKAHVRTAYRHWDELHTDQIKSRRLLELFRKVYRAYSPHEEEEVFAISPWIPGMWYFKNTSKHTGLQENRIGSCYSAPPRCSCKPKTAIGRSPSRLSAKERNQSSADRRTPTAAPTGNGVSTHPAGHNVTARPATAGHNVTARPSHNVITPSRPSSRMTVQA